MFTKRSICRRLLALLLVVLMPTALWAQPVSIGVKGQAAVGKKVMVATAHPLASQAALQIFRKGGNAIDAAVAAAFVIGVVEPDASGLGGGGGMIIRTKNGKVAYIDYYPKASARVKEVGFVYGKDNQTAKAILIPGNVAGLATALRDYGTLKLATVMKPAIEYAEKGFKIDETLSKIILDNVTLVLKHPATAEIYSKDDFPLAEGDVVRQPVLAKTLKQIAKNGPKAFYSGAVAKTICEEVVKNGGMLTLEDLQNYAPKVREPVAGTYRGLSVYSAPPPHSGAVVIEALNILENADLKQLGYYANSTDAFHILAETMRRAYADRMAYIADPGFEKVPVRGLISKAFAKTRFDDISMAAVTPPNYKDTKPGDLSKFNDDAAQEQKKPSESRWDGNSFDEIVLEAAGGHTTQISVMDAEGNMVSLTQTLGTFFGSGITAAGVLLNNAMSNFAFTARVNSLEPNKQPRSSISPTILLKDGKPFLVTGSPGAIRIMTTVVTLIVNAVDYGLDAEKTNHAPRFLCQRSDPFLSLESRFTPEVREGMKEKGHTLQLYGDYDLFFGGAQIILRDTSGTMQGSADPRRGGTAIGY